MSNYQSKNNKRALVIFGIVIVLALAIKLYSFHWPRLELFLNGQVLRVLVANTPERLYNKGLGGRADLDTYDGMIFIFPTEDRHGIVMRDMIFPIDIIWIKDGVIVDIAPNAPVELGKQNSELTVYLPRDNADFVLEMPAGRAEMLGLKIGDRLEVKD